MKIEAALTSSCTGPSAAAARSSRLPAWLNSVRSASTTQAMPPLSAISSASAAAASTELLQWIATAKPFAARSSTMARPIRFAPPVTSAVTRLFVMSHLGGVRGMSPAVTISAAVHGLGVNVAAACVWCRPERRFSARPLKYRAQKPFDKAGLADRSTSPDKTVAEAQRLVSVSLMPANLPISGPHGPQLDTTFGTARRSGRYPSRRPKTSPVWNRVFGSRGLKE